MKLNLNEINPSLRQRIERQLAAEDAGRAKAQAHDDGVCAGPIPQSQPGASLVNARKGKGKGKKGVGHRYHIKFTVFAVRPRDWDNLAASCKQIQDAIVESGLLPDDDWRTLEGHVVSTKAESLDKERTVVEIWRIS